MHFLITGHTGFKGSWLSLLLAESGHEVSGVALDPEKESMFEVCKVSQVLSKDIRSNILDKDNLDSIFADINPDVIIHFAAQPLVRKSYFKPIETFEVNAIGTLNVLNASRKAKNLKAQLIVTTDKVYKNTNSIHGYLESDQLGGTDPYSASKAMADIAAQSWIQSFDCAPTAIARGGNVIGGGDFAADRLIPDVLRNLSAGQIPSLRFPNAVRPWQHVLDCLDGYMSVVKNLLHGGVPDIWNIGPMPLDFKKVEEVANLVIQYWGAGVNWESTSSESLSESQILVLNSDKIRSVLDWSERLDFDRSVSWTVEWYKDYYAGRNPLEKTLDQINNYNQLS
jgi:CDP-glucose 4,6-dehydratase